MIHRVIAAAAFALTAAAIVPVSAQAAQLHIFRSESAAHHYCPRDQVVWLNLPTHIYHFRGERWYAHTKDGAFVCRRQADEFGNRPSENGQ